MIHLYKASLIFILLLPVCAALAQEEEPIVYFQMEPLDDSLFIEIQQLFFIDPPDPKAEIIVDLRDANNQTISIRGALYPFLALTPELRAQIINYPFKINMEETINFGSVFTDVISKLRFERIINTPSVFQISPTLGYINPFLQFFGGERFGFSLKKDVGFSFGLGTPYSGPLETNVYEFNFHILGLKAGILSNDDTFIEHKFENNHNNILFVNTFQISYTVPFGNFFEFGYAKTNETFRQTKLDKYVRESNLVRNPDGTIKYQPYLVQGSFINWEFRYPFRLLESTRGKFYAAKYLDEMHAGFTGRELSLAGSVFDLRFDAMFNSPHRQPQYVLDIMVQKVFDYWGFSAVAVGPAVIVSNVKSGRIGFTSFFVNLRLKVGTSL